MRIKSESPTELVVVESTEWLSYIFLCIGAVLFFTIGLHGNSPKAFLPSGVILAIGAVWFLRTEVILDNVRRQAQWTRRRLFWVKSRTVAFDDIQGVVMATSIGQNNEQTYRLEIVTSQGSVPMSDTYSGGKQSHEKLQATILRFLGLEAGEAGRTLDEETIRSLLAQGRRIDAIQLLCSKKGVGLTAATKMIETIEAQPETK